MEGEDGDDFEEGDRDTEGDKPVVKAGEFDSAENGERGVAGEEEIIADAVGDEEAGKARALLRPDHFGRRGEDADCLKDLSEREKEKEPEEGADGFSDDGTGEKKNAEDIDDGGTGDEQG